MVWLEHIYDWVHVWEALTWFHQHSRRFSTLAMTTGVWLPLYYSSQNKGRTIGGQDHYTAGHTTDLGLWQGNIWRHPFVHFCIFPFPFHIPASLTYRSYHYFWHNLILLITFMNVFRHFTCSLAWCQRSCRCQRSIYIIRNCQKTPKENFLFVSEMISLVGMILLC